MRRRERFPKPGTDQGKKLIKARMGARQLVDGESDYRVACDTLCELFDSGQPFLSDLGYFNCGYWSQHDDEGLANSFATEFLKRSDEWVRSL